MKIYRMLVRGAQVVVRAYTTDRAYKVPSQPGFKLDQARLRRDVKNLGGDLRSAIAKRGQYANQSSGD